MAKQPLIPQLCACGCGEYAAVDERRNRVSKFISGHNSRSDHPMAGRSHTSEARAKIKVARAKQTNVVGGGPAVTPPIERFLRHVTATEGGCWPWTGGLNQKGYGVFGIGSTKDGSARFIGAHRFAYEFWTGPLDPELEIDHLCHNRRCVNPDHLEQVTHEENIRRRRPAGE